MEIQLPNDLSKMLKGATYKPETIGCTKDTVLRYEKNDEIFFLKTGELTHESYRERDMLQWLKGKLPVPGMLYWHENATTFFMLTSQAVGTMACTEHGIPFDENTVIKALADGILQLQSIKSCPLSNRLDQRLETALHNIKNELVDIDDFDGKGRTPMELYDYLMKNKPSEELVLTHGDYCLPNIFINGDKTSGFIDMGRGGIADKYQDIALCYRSLKYNLFGKGDENLLFQYLGITPDWNKIEYYILLDELF